MRSTVHVFVLAWDNNSCFYCFSWCYRLLSCACASSLLLLSSKVCSVFVNVLYITLLFLDVFLGLAPTSHTIPGTVQAVNGSQANVGCTGTRNPFVCLNLDPATAGGATSYLVDGNILAPLDFSDTNWARELMTVNHNGGDFDIRINFNSAYATRMDLVLFNCPDWGIGAMDITVETGVSQQLEVLGNFTLQNTSCDSLLTVCVPLIMRSNSTITYAINFLTGSNSDIDWTYIAEVTFYNDSVECADPFPVTPAPTEPTGMHT